MVASEKEQKVTPALVDACRRGDREAFRVLYEACRDDVYSMALHFFHGDPATAADVTQQVFLKLIDKVGQFRGDSGFSTWLHRFVANVCIDRTRSAWYRAPQADPVIIDEQPSAGSQEETLVQSQTAADIRVALARLTPGVRMAVILRYFKGLSYAEMASVLGCSKGTVASRLARGHELLGRELAHLDPAGVTRTSR